MYLDLYKVWNSPTHFVVNEIVCILSHIILLTVLPHLLDSKHLELGEYYRSSAMYLKGWFIDKCQNHYSEQILAFSQYHALDLKKWNLSLRRVKKNFKHRLQMCSDGKYWVLGIYTSIPHTAQILGIDYWLSISN